MHLKVVIREDVAPLLARMQRRQRLIGLVWFCQDDEAVLLRSLAEPALALLSGEHPHRQVGEEVFCLALVDGEDLLTEGMPISGHAEMDRWHGVVQRR